jgi:hypothetical protein
MHQALTRMRFLRVPVLAHKWVWVLFLMEITKRVVHLPVLTLICSDCYLLVDAVEVFCEGYMHSL